MGVSASRERQQPSRARHAVPSGFAQERVHPSATFSSREPHRQDLLDLQQTIGNRAVLRMLNEAVQQPPLTPAPTAPLLQRMCACDEHKHDEESVLQRKPAGSGGPTGVPPIVHEVLRSPGQGLDRSARDFFEPRFGRDFSRVRVHTGAQAAESTRAVEALAYTVGPDIVFGAGGFDPQSHSGKQLLAHELTHVLQQSAAVHPSRELRISHPNEAAERQASAMSASVLAPLHSPILAPSRPRALVSQHSVLARQAVPVEVPVEEGPANDNEEVDDQEDVNENDKNPGNRPAQRSAPRPRNNSLEGILEQISMENQRKRAIFEAELPVATLERGGKPPKFVTFEHDQQILTLIGRGGEILNTKQYGFHILDAIEYAVGFANNNPDLLRILQMFIPRPSDAIPYRPMTLPALPAFRIPPNVDPDGIERLKVFDAAVAKRKEQSPSLAKEPALALAPLTKDSPEKKRRKRCTITPLRGHLGGDPLATIFCQYATKSPLEYRITSPLFGYVDADAVRGNTMYECKCGYASLLRGLDKQKWWAKLQEDRLTEQMLRHQRIVQDCGLQYRFIVSNPEFAEFLRSVWPSVDIIEVPWEPCD